MLTLQHTPKRIRAQHLGLAAGAHGWGWVQLINLLLLRLAAASIGAVDYRFSATTDLSALCLGGMG